ncbi:hypothetical protein [Sphingobium sp.]|uniref:hypothetical protein n=1 Tax=Sphingobium sp. TaxID=1912891 RepID=UPI002CEDD139|nr:hypothetical protein [Sphingobium sp.]HUD91239.1 hypothetical protein [Sphingobium sp.]
MLASILAITIVPAVFGGGFALAVFRFVRETRKINTDELSHRFSLTKQHRLVITPRKSTYVAGALLGFAIAAPLAALVAQGVSDYSAVAIMLLLGITYFMAHNVRMFLWKGPFLQIDKNGIQYRLWSDAVIPWQAIIGLKRYEYKEGERIMIYVDPAYQPQTMTRRFLPESAVGRLYLNLSGTSHRLGHLLAAFRLYRPDLYH